MLDAAQLPLPLDLAPPLALAAPSGQRRTRLATTRAAKPDPGPAAERIVARPAPSACEAAMLRAARRVYLNLATHWSLTGREALVLLGEPEGDEAEREARLQALVGLTRLMQMVRPGCERACGFLRGPHPALGGTSPLQDMLAGGLPAIGRVRAVLARESGD